MTELQAVNLSTNVSRIKTIIYVLGLEEVTQGELIGGSL